MAGKQQLLGGERGLDMEIAGSEEAGRPASGLGAEIAAEPQHSHRTERTKRVF